MEEKITADLGEETIILLKRLILKLEQLTGVKNEKEFTYTHTCDDKFPQ